jgi:asparagine synthase (glutamine-hydrolysing)
VCGLVGLYSPVAAPDIQTLQRMSDSLVHRGPDDAGTWAQGNVALAHRRLSVVDLSVAGQQPMVSHSGRWVMCYNGEIYNAETLRKTLPETAWRGHSDTEVILEAFEHWGVERAARQFNGMFAIAAFDTQRKELWLVRDRLGIKPLFFGWLGQNFAFASELSPFKHLPEGRSVDPDSIRSYLRYGYVPAPHSIHRGITKLEPGHIAKIALGDRPSAGTQPIVSAYWSFREFAKRPRLDISEEEAVDQLQTLLRTAVKDRLVSDVPLGAFLSGGYDSSLVCALMQEQATQPAKTFTIGFDDPAYNEAEDAKQIAAHLGTEHTELYVSEQDMLKAVERLPQLCDEPFADSSILPTYLVSDLARQHVTVSLSGDGGDELFWGYQRYQTSLAIWQKISRIPAPVRKMGSAFARNAFVQALSRHIPVPAWGGRPGMLNQKLLRAEGLFGAHSFGDSYERLMSQWIDPNLLLAGEDRGNAYRNRDHWTWKLPFEQRMAAQDMLMYLPDDILTKVDRASMSVSLEARVPLLDHRVVEFAAQLPDHFKRTNTTSKYLLRKVLARYIPAELTERPKKGFGVPLGSWLRGPLQVWAADLLAPSSIRRQGLLNPQPIDTLWQEHLRGHADNSAKLWPVLMLQLWLQNTG